MPVAAMQCAMEKLSPTAGETPARSSFVLTSALNGEAVLW
jgi:hypothetical protein